MDTAKHTKLNSSLTSDLRCPADIVLRPTDKSVVTVRWDEPKIAYHSVALTVSSTSHSGDSFSVGTETVTYTVEGYGPNGRVYDQCSFNVTVIGKLWIYLFICLFICLFVYFFFPTPS